MNEPSQSAPRGFDAAKLGAALAVGLGVWVVALGLGLFIGTDGLGWPVNANVLEFRVERLWLASVIGAALAVSGATYQAILRNPLADPYLLGVSSGAMLAAFVWTLPAVGAAGAILTAVGSQGSAFVGAVTAVSIVLVAAARRGRVEPVTLLLTGVVLNAINASAFLLLVELFADTATPGGAEAFLVGRLPTDLLPEQIVLASLLVVGGAVLLLAWAPKLNAVALPEDEARALGVSVQRVRWGGLVVASLVVAAGVAISGPIGFVGLIAPHLVRTIVGNDQRLVLPVAASLGAVLLVAADAGVRLFVWAGLPTALPVGIVTALMGGPFFLVLLLRTRRAAAAVRTAAS